MGLSRIALVLLALPTAAPTQPSAIGSFQQRVLDIHNRERAAIGSAPLRWNPQLEQDAVQHAQQLARTGQLAHAPREGRGVMRENLSRGPLGWGPDQLMRNWMNEKRYFHGGIYPDVCRGGWSACAHYTQVIWPGTTDVGCGAAAGGGFSWFVCRYSPGGNKDGRRLGAAVDPLYSGTPGPIDSSKSRQRLGTPGQAHQGSNLEVLCRPLPPLGGGTGTGAIGEAAAHRKELQAEAKRIQAAIKAVQAGIEDYDPNLIEELLGTADAPPTEQLLALSKRMKELTKQIEAEQERIEDMLREISEYNDKRRARDRLCGRVSRKPGEVE
jgi:hypothetical protein